MQDISKYIKHPGRVYAMFRYSKGHRLGIVTSYVRPWALCEVLHLAGVGIYSQATTTWHNNTHPLGSQRWVGVVAFVTPNKPQSPSNDALFVPLP
jgi:hypothetical protein